MRTPNPTSRRLQARAHARRRPLIAEIAHLVDRALEDQPGHAAVHVTFTDDDELDLGVLPIPSSVHPFSVLSGTVAPDTWALFGVRVLGVAHHLEPGHGDLGLRESTSTSARCCTTYLVCRSGAEVAVLHESDRTSVIHEPAEGTIPDLCRLVMGMPTPPPPAPTSRLFTLAWLDRVLALALAHPTVALNAKTVAAFHPSGTTVTEPARFAAHADAHSASWPWSRLRTEPEHLPLPGSDLPPDVTSWMDDGAYARWALGAFPSAMQLRGDLGDLLEGEALDLVTRATTMLLASDHAA